METNPVLNLSVLIVVFFKERARLSDFFSICHTRKTLIRFDMHRIIKDDFNREFYRQK